MRTRDKGGVESQIGWFRRNHLVPVPEVASITELNAMIDDWDISDDARRIGTRPHTIGEHFPMEKPLLKPLPDEPFETGRWFTPRVDRYAQVTIRTNRYSVPVRMIGRQVRVLLHASELVVYDRRTEIAGHERLLAKGGTRLDLDHYLEGLLRKPGALPGATALDQARAAGKFTSVHDAWWAAARKAHGDRDGTTALIEVLLLHRHLPHDQVVAGLAAALRSGALTADAVALEARKIGDTRTGDSVSMDLDAAPVVSSLTQRRITQLPPDSRAVRPAAPPPQYSGRRPIMTTTITPAAGTSTRRRHGLTEQAADAAVDQACRMLRLPTIRGQFEEIADAAAASRCPTAGSSRSC